MKYKHIIKNLKSKIWSHSDFNKNIVILSSGTLISQGLLVLISPILTRLYSPEAFGVLMLTPGDYTENLFGIGNSSDLIAEIINKKLNAAN